MSVTFFTGRKASLRPRLLKEIQAALSDGQNRDVIVLVPQQLTLETEMLALEGLRLQGSFRLSVLSPSRLAGLIFEEAGKPASVTVDERGRALLMGKTLRELNKKLKWYHGAKDKRGFEMRIVDEISRLKQAGVTPDALFSIAEDAQDSALKWKTHDIALLYKAYEEGLEGKFQDGEDETEEAIRRMDGAKSIKNAYVFAFGFDLTTPIFNRLFAAAAACCVRACAFLPLENDGMARDFTLYQPLQDSYERMLVALRERNISFERVYLETEAAALKAHVHFAREVFSSPCAPFSGANSSFQLALLLNPMEEARFCAALVRRLVQKNGWKYSDIVVLCDATDGYGDALDSAFEAYDVPLFRPDSRPADRHPLPRFLLETLKIISGTGGELASLITTGYTDLNEDEADALLSYAARKGLTARGILKPVKRGTPEEIAEIEEIRKRVADPILRLDQEISRANTLTEQLAAVFLYLSELNCARKGELARQKLVSLGYRVLAAEDAQVWNRVMGALDQMNALAGEKKLSKAVFTDILSRALANAEIKPLPQSQDAVNALSAARMGFKPVKAILMVGAISQGQAAENGLFAEDETEKLSQTLGVYLAPTGLNKIRTERMYIKDALSLATDYICVSYSMSGPDGAMAVPGAIVGEIRRIFPQIRVRGGVGEDDSMSSMRYGAPVASEMQAAVELSEGEATGSAKAALYSLGKLSAEALERIKAALTHRTESESLGEPLSRLVYGRIDKVSATRLETFAGCPFAHFVKYALKPEREEPFGLNARDEGGFFHEAVCRFLTESMSDISGLSREEAARRMNRISDDILEGAIRDAMSGTNTEKADVKKLRRTVTRAARTLADQLKNCAFQPVELEMEFGETGPTLRLNSGASARVAGRIDRVDLMEDGEERYLRIIDYKRSSKAPEAEEMYHGLQLQLILYLAAAMKKYGAKSAGAFYFRVDDPVIFTDIRDEEEIERLRLDKMRMEGILPSDTELIRLMAEEPEHVFRLRFLKDGSLSKNTDAATDEEFQLLMNHALKVAGRITRLIETGDTRISPALTPNRNACAYCEYRSACMIDKRIPGAGQRTMKKMSFTEMYELLRNEKQP